MFMNRQGMIQFQAFLILAQRFSMVMFLLFKLHVHLQLATPGDYDDRINIGGSWRTSWDKSQRHDDACDFNFQAPGTPQSLAASHCDKTIKIPSPSSCFTLLLLFQVPRCLARGLVR
jgi:hypothetical protein